MSDNVHRLALRRLIISLTVFYYLCSYSDSTSFFFPYLYLNVILATCSIHLLLNLIMCWRFDWDPVPQRIHYERWNRHRLGIRH